jgi:predicted dehydrogenase
MSRHWHYSFKRDRIRRLWSLLSHRGIGRRRKLMRRGGVFPLFAIATRVSPSVSTHLALSLDAYDKPLALINDPSIDCIYNPLPNGLRYRWRLAALKAGKHVLEKPSASNAEEARALFNHPLLQAPNSPVVVEANHYRFHPAWHLFNSQFNK